MMITVMFSSCSSDSDSSAFESNILIDSVPFIPKTIVATPGSASSAEKAIVFILKKNINTGANFDEIVFRINYPNTQANASGTYIMNGIQGTGTYDVTPETYGLYNGSVVVEDLGNNSFNLTFQNIKGSHFISHEIITISGTLQGKFSE